jgi:hypothetical protein
MRMKEIGLVSVAMAISGVIAQGDREIIAASAANVSLHYISHTWHNADLGVGGWCARTLFFGALIDRSYIMV